jgi:hypothetical protein
MTLYYCLQLQMTTVPRSQYWPGLVLERGNGTCRTGILFLQKLLPPNLLFRSRRGRNSAKGSRKSGGLDLGVEPARCLRDRRYESKQDAPERGKYPGISTLAYFCFSA